MGWLLQELEPLAEACEDAAEELRQARKHMASVNKYIEGYGEDGFVDKPRATARLDMAEAQLEEVRDGIKQVFIRYLGELAPHLFDMPLRE